MPFDMNLVLIDGSVDLTVDTDIPAISVVRDGATGAVVLDLRETGVRGLAAVLVCPTDPPAADNTLNLVIEESDSEASGYVPLVSFDQVGDVPPGTYMERFATAKRYVRANITIAGTVGVNYGKVGVLISPYPWKVL